MIKPFQIASGPRVRFGSGEAAFVGEEAAALGMKHPMLLTDPGLSAAGVLTPIVEGLENTVPGHHLFEQAETNPSDEST